MRLSTVERGASTRGNGRPVRRAAVAAFVAAMMIGSVAGPAGAWSLRIRTDGNDSDARADIRRVVTDLTPRTVFFRIDTWQRFHPAGQNAYFIVRFDAGGDRELDRVLEIYRGPHGYTCLLEESEPGGDPGAVLGDRRARRDNLRSVECRLPRSWFPRIQRAVRFYVRTLGSPSDRAPNEGLYRWL